jgi:large subunit ribosomal protein L3
MCDGLLGKKMGMTGYFLSDGRYVPATILQVGPCFVTQIKTKATDGYDAIQIGFGQKKKSRINKPIRGHLKKCGDFSFAHFREFEVQNPENYSLGQKITVDIFNVGSMVDIAGHSKGRGFAGVVKRHGFAGGKETHGCRSHRVPGSIGCSAWPSRVMKGKKLPGHYGTDRKTIKNLEILDIRPDHNILLIKGAVPGSISGLVEIKQLKSLKA